MSGGANPSTMVRTSRMSLANYRDHMTSIGIYTGNHMYSYLYIVALLA
jgi:hypothetical protein